MSSTIKVNNIQNLAGDDSGIDLSTNDQIILKTANTTAITVDSSQNVFVTKTSSDVAVVGQELRSSGFFASTRDGATVSALTRLSSDGTILEFRKDSSAVGSIDAVGGKLTLNSQGSNLVFNVGGTTYINMDSTHIYPQTDNAYDLGSGGNRFDDVFATNGTIQTSDQNEKNTITDSDLGIDFIKRLEPKSYIFNGKTRTHYGLIAQDVETVLSDINKPTSGFAGFCKDDISEEQDGSGYRYGLRYHEFVAPLIKAVKEQQTIIEDLQARITALESE